MTQCRTEEFNNRIMHPKFTLLVAGALFPLSSSAQNHQILLDTMDFPDYFVSLVYYGDPTNFSYAYGEEFTDPGADGNPGAYFQVVHEHDVERDENEIPLGNSFVTAESVVTNSDLYYNPTSSGPLGELTYAVDYRISGDADFTFFIKNAGNGSGRSLFDGMSPIITDGQWRTAILSGVTQEDVSNVSFTGNNAIQFGFVTNSSAEVELGPEITTFDFDNFRVTNSIPEPSGLVLLGLASSMAFLRRRR